MAQVSLSLPAPLVLNATDVGWGRPGSPVVNLGDVSELAAGSGTVLLGNLSLFSRTNIPRRAVLYTTPNTSTVASGAGPELSESWEGSAVAITLRAPTLPDLVLPGPSSAGLDSSDASEPYAWDLSAAQDAAAYSNGASSGISGWLSDFNALTGAQQAGATLVLDDGVTPTQDHEVDAGSADWTFEAAQPAVTKTTAHAVDAGSAGWAFALPQPQTTHVLPDNHQVNAEAAEWTFVLPQPQVTSSSAVAHTVDAGAASWTFALPQPTVTRTAATSDNMVDAGTAHWSFDLPRPQVSGTAVGSGVDPEARKITLWAENGDRTDPEDVGMNRLRGFGDPFSQPGGQQISRAVVNQMIRELSGAFLEFIECGIPEWDPEVSYVHPAFIRRGETVHTSVRDNRGQDPDTTDAWRVY